LIPDRPDPQEARTMRTLLFALAVTVPSADGAPPELAQEERLLRDAGIGVDGPGLLAFFKDRTLSPEDVKRLSAAVRQLGDEDFAVREKASRDLVRAGRPALAVLRTAADDSDFEVSRRARACIEEIDNPGFAARGVAAARLLAVRKPPGAVETLLAFLPFADEESVEDAVLDTLLVLGMKDGRADAAVAAAATASERARRMAAAHVLGRATVPEQRRMAHRMLTDADQTVRFRAAVSLAMVGDREAVPALAALLTDAPLPLAWRSEDLLHRLAGDKAPTANAGTWDEAGRKRCRAAWEMWWKEKGPNLVLAKVDREDALLGINLVAELDGSARSPQGGRVWECGPDGKQRWEHNLNRPIDAQPQPGGRILIAYHDGNLVNEIDREGKVIWTYRTEGQNPVSAQRLPNGNTFIATYNSVREVRPDGTKLYEYAAQGGMIYNAVKLRNGNMVLAQSNNAVVELDPMGKPVATVPVPNTGGWASAEKLPNGRYLVALYSGGRVVEVDATGKEFWSVKCESAGHATRLRNGNTLVASIEGKRIVEFDPNGKEVWSQATEGRPFHVYRR
jgi:hypothetical protein